MSNNGQWLVNFVATFVGTFVENEEVEKSGDKLKTKSRDPSNFGDQCWLDA